MSSASPTRVLGIMSGSSLDGLDLALCGFERGNGIWNSRILAGTAVPFPAELRTRLLDMARGSAFDLAKAHGDLGTFIGEQAAHFLRANGGAELVASHGHTIFHQPDVGFTTQIGCGARLAALTGLPTVVDFRSKDVALNGQGAPLVPIGERDLFPDSDAFVNLGGIANIALHGSSITGYDVCVCNQALNFLAGEAGQDFDRDGKIARSGRVDAALLEKLNATPFVLRAIPRSMGREHFEAEVLPLLKNSSLSLADRMRTMVEHIAAQVSSALRKRQAVKVLVTGGGAHNAFLVERLRADFPGEVHLPDRLTIDFKEAMIFAYLGLLRWNGEVNALASVTGASRDSIGGAVYLPN
jgi:anhydro-N-acetylmuramic acid kinase